MKDKINNDDDYYDYNVSKNEYTPEEVIRLLKDNKLQLFKSDLDDLLNRYNAHMEIDDNYGDSPFISFDVDGLEYIYNGE